jgi:hypothetical protein
MEGPGELAKATTSGSAYIRALYSTSFELKTSFREPLAAADQTLAFEQRRVDNVPTGTL